MPNISFLMPVHNGAEYLAQTMDSLLAQDFDDFDILIIDDGSTDSTADIISRFRSPKIKLIQQENRGLVDALNAGLGLLDCTYVARIDADDICFSNRLSSQLDYITFTQADVISCKSIHIDEVGHPLGISVGANIFERDPFWYPAREPYLSHPFMFGRLDVLEKFGYRNAHLSEDADLCWRMCDDYRLAIQNEVLGKYRLHQNSVSTGSLGNIRVQAFYASLAALNYVRRQQDLAEIPYAISLELARTHSDSIENLVHMVQGDLSRIERARLVRMSNAKLLHLSSWRGIDLTHQDVANIVAHLDEIEGITSENRLEIASYIAQANAKIATSHKK